MQSNPDSHLAAGVFFYQEPEMFQSVLLPPVLSSGHRRKLSRQRIAISPLKMTSTAIFAWSFVTAKAGWPGGYGTLNRMPEPGLTRISDSTAF